MRSIKSIKKDFWDRYFNCEDELEERDILLELTFIDESNVDYFKSYIDDIIEYMKEKERLEND